MAPSLEERLITALRGEPPCDNEEVRKLWERARGQLFVLGWNEIAKDSVNDAYRIANRECGIPLQRVAYVPGASGRRLDSGFASIPAVPVFKKAR